MEFFIKARSSFIEFVKYYNENTEIFTSIQYQALIELRKLWIHALPFFGKEYFFWMKKYHDQIHSERILEGPWVVYISDSFILRMSLVNKLEELDYEEREDPFVIDNYNLWRGPVTYLKTP